MKWSPDRYREAYVFAARAHLRSGLVRSSVLPYHAVHFGCVFIEVMVSLNIEPACDPDLAIECALLHDTLEDTETEYSDIEATFGRAVAEGVAALSKNRCLAKELQMRDSLSRIKKQPHEVWRVKLADRITNLRKPVPHWSPAQINAYGNESREIGEALRDASPYLAARLTQKLSQYQRNIIHER